MRERREEKETERSILLHFTAIRRIAFHKIVTRNETKSCTPVLVQRFINNHYSFPYGFIAE